MAKTFLFSLLMTVLLITFSSADAQQSTKVPLIGYVTASSRSNVPARIEAFQRGMRDLGTLRTRTGY